MGLDGVELIMAIEEEFKFAITDDEAFRLDTVGKLVDLVLSRLRQSRADPCPSQQSFYVVRRTFMTVLDLPRGMIRPETPLADLLPLAGRRKKWSALLEAMVNTGHRWPRLVRPRWLNRLVLLVAPGLVFGLSLIWLPAGWAFMAALVALVMADRLTAPWQREFPVSCTQVRDLVPFVKPLDARVWTREEVFHKVRAITVEQLGVKEELVTMDARFIEDLGVG